MISGSLNIPQFFFRPSRKDLARFLAVRIPLTLFFATVLYRLGQCDWILPYSGDGHYTEELAEKDWVVLMHSSLTTLMHKCVYTLLKPWGWTAWKSVMVSSSLAGGMALQVLYAIRRHPAFLAINILSGSFFVFVGEVENYAWVNLFLLWTFLAVERFLERKWPFWPAAVFFFTAALFHMLALFYLPALFWVMYQQDDFKPWEFAGPFLLFVFLSIGIMVIFPREGPDLNLGRLVPLFQINRKGQFFTLFSPAHLELLLYFHRQAGLLRMIPVSWIVLILFFRRIETPFHKYLLIGSLTGLGWTTVWHPDLGRLDWDLFSQMYIPFNVLAGLLISGRPNEWRFFECLKKRIPHIRRRKNGETGPVSL